MVAEGGKDQDQQLPCVHIREALDPFGRGGNTHIEGHRLILSSALSSSGALVPRFQRLTCPGFAGHADPLGGVCAVRDPRSG